MRFRSSGNPVAFHPAYRLLERRTIDIRIYSKSFYKGTRKIRTNDSRYFLRYRVNFLAGSSNYLITAYRIPIIHEASIIGTTWIMPLDERIDVPSRASFCRARSKRG